MYLVRIASSIASSIASAAALLFLWPACPCPAADQQRSGARRPAAPLGAGGVEALLQSAERSLKAGRQAAAVADLRRAAERAPRDPRPHQRLAAILRQAGYLDQEIEELEDALRLAPRDAESALRLAGIYIGLVWFDRARTKVVQAELADSDNPQLFVLLATQAYMRFQYPQMERAATEGLRRWPGNIVLMTLLSEANRLQGRLPDAEALLRQALTVATERRRKAACHTGLARLLLADGWPKPRFAAAEQEARAALKSAPDDVDAHYWLGQALERQGRWKEAIPPYEITLRRDPQFEAVAFRLGRLYLRTEDNSWKAKGAKLLTAYRRQMTQDERYRNAREAVWEHPERADAHRRMAQEYLSAGQVPQAIVELRQTLKMRPENAPARKMLHQALLRAGRLTEAKRFG